MKVVLVWLMLVSSAFCQEVRLERGPDGNTYPVYVDRRYGINGAALLPEPVRAPVRVFAGETGGHVQRQWLFVPSGGNVFVYEEGGED